MKINKGTTTIAFLGELVYALSRRLTGERLGGSLVFVLETAGYNEVIHERFFINPR
jgi:hypothetical protein